MCGPATATFDVPTAERRSIAEIHQALRLEFADCRCEKTYTDWLARQLALVRASAPIPPRRN